MSNPNYDRANVSVDYFNAESQDVYHLTQATLAVAYEQRTANLIAWHGIIDGDDPLVEELYAKILDRLALGAK